MEKLSLYNLLSVLLPGALLTFVIKIILESHGLGMISLKDQDYFSLVIYVSSSLFLGSLINILGIKFLPVLKFFGLYDSVQNIFENNEQTNTIKSFVLAEVQKIDEVNDYKKYESLWALMYYELEAIDKIGIPKDFQSFYFFFRNFFTLGLILFLPLLFQMIYFWDNDLYKSLFISSVIGAFLSIISGKWNRKKMVERMFWTYYSLHKKN